MTGPEHYQRAEHLLRYAEHAEKDEHADQATAMAQAHATLALAAATAMSAPVEDVELGMAVHEFRAWYQAAGVQPDTTPKES